MHYQKWEDRRHPGSEGQISELQPYRAVAGDILTHLWGLSDFWQMKKGQHRGLMLTVGLQGRNWASASLSTQTGPLLYKDGRGKVYLWEEAAKKYFLGVGQTILGMPSQPAGRTETEILSVLLKPELFLKIFKKEEIQKKMPSWLQATEQDIMNP